MKTKLLLTSSLAFILSIANAQWVMQNTNFSNTIHGVASINLPSATVAWAVGYNGSGTPLASNPDFAVTNNAGATWTSKTITTTGVTTHFVIANISAIDGNTAFACLYDTTLTATQGIYKTTDGGTTWTRSAGAAYGTSSWPDLVHFFNANDGVAFGDPVGGYYEIYTTNNGGTSWARTPNTGNVLNPVPAAEYGLANSFGAFGNTICVGTNHGRIFRSADKGLTWTVATTPLTSPGTAATDIHKIEFKDANNALAGSIYINGVANSTFTFLNTTDGGITWSFVPATGAIFGADFCVVPGTNFYINTGADYTTHNQGSSISTDDGITWQLLEDTTGFATSTTGQRTAVEFFSSNLGYAGGFTGNPATTGGIFQWSGPVAPLVGINNPASADIFATVYPNPCAENLSISLSGIQGKQTEVRICNVVGQVVYQSSTVYNTPIFTKHIDIRNFAKGIYIVTVNNGTDSFAQKLIKD